VTLEAALAAVRRGDDAAARAALIAAWRARRSAILAELVHALDARSPDDVRAKLDAVLAPRVATTIARFRAVQQLDDPRVARFAIDSLVALPFTTPAVRPLLVELLETAVRLRDPRLVAREREIRDAIATRLSPKAGRDVLLNELDGALAKLAEPAAASAEDAALERDLAAALASARAPARSLASLLDDIYAHPFDDAPRAVYADALAQQGDPRGEFITLQLARGRGGEPGEREGALVKKHGKAWLGALAPVLSFGKHFAKTTFERGFVCAADIILSVGKKLEPLLRDPAWATVETLCGRYSFELLEQAPLRALRALHDHRFSAEQLARLAARAEPLTGIETIAIDESRIDPATLRRAFANVRVVQFGAPRVQLDTIATLERLGVERLEIGIWSEPRPERFTQARLDFAALVDALFARAAGANELTLIDPYTPEPIVFHRGADGRYTR
jgi:uncharacterized protein (TIGR02996 family)